MQTTLMFSLTDAQIYDADHLQIWHYFKVFTFQMISRGYKRVGSKMIFERIRWETMIKGDGTFKINNNFTPYYSRKFETQYPEYVGIFEKRECGIEVV